MKHNLNASEIYTKKRNNLNGLQPAKYALYFVSWLIVLSSFAGLIA